MATRAEAWTSPDFTTGVGEWGCIKHGWLEKEGGRKGGYLFKRRFFVLVGSTIEEMPGRFLVYYESGTALMAKGAIHLSHGNYTVSPPKGVRRGHPHVLRVDIAGASKDTSSKEKLKEKNKWILACEDEVDFKEWYSALDEDSAVLTRKDQLSALLLSRPQSALEPTAEKCGFLYKEGRVNTAFKKRFVMLVPPADTGGAHDGVLSNITLDRWLVYYKPDERDKPSGVMSLPMGGYSVERLTDHAEKGQVGELALRIAINEGPDAGRHIVLAPDPGGRADTILFSWELSLRAGEWRPSADAWAESMLGTPVDEDEGELRARLPSPAEQETLAGLEADMSGSVSAEDPQDLALLRQVWAVLGEGPFVPKGEAWKAFGFQRDDPLSDIRGGGRLALKQLVHFLTHHTSTARAMCRSREDFASDFAGYPWAASGVNVTRMVCMIFDIGMRSGALLPGIKASSLYCRRKYWHVVANADIFNDLYSVAFEMLDRDFTVHNEKYMSFNNSLARTRDHLVHVLESSESPTELASEFHSRALRTDAPSRGVWKSPRFLDTAAPEPEPAGGARVSYTKLHADLLSRAAHDEAKQATIIRRRDRAMTHSAQGEELRSFFARTPSSAELGALMEEQNALLEIKSGALAPQEQDRALTLQRLQAGNVRDELEATRLQVLALRREMGL